MKNLIIGFAVACYGAVMIAAQVQVPPYGLAPAVSVSSFAPSMLNAFTPIAGTTNAFPGLRRNGQTVEFVLADQSAYTSLAATAFTFALSGGFLLSPTGGSPQFVTAAVSGQEFNLGVPTLGTCTAGALTSGSHNFAGQYTGNTSSSCVINFGTPNFTNTPFCFAMSTASTTHPRISAASASSITVTGGVSGETIQYLCQGRIGT